ncbi:MAG: (d)CMP kinase [Alphaproteobacteria bacterium]|nr:(d)CMP kinase [Alphaproteobacteria bacterium]
MIITIDGPAAAGKGTISAYLSQKYHLAYFDTGMVYRAVGLQMVLTGLNLQNQNAALKIAQNLTFPQMMELSVHPDFRSDIGGQAASIVSAYPTVRAALLNMQKNFALKPTFADGQPAKGVVYDGRDTGTIICPNADLKLFVTASPQIRAERRYKEFLQKGMITSYEKVLADMIARDERDSKRTNAPLKPAEDAVIIDTSDLSIDDVLAYITPLVEAKL